MSTQRPRTTRRGLLAAGGGAVATGGWVALAGRGFDGGDSEPVSILAAGSLQHVLSNEVRDAVEERIQIEARGSVAAARLVADGARDPDILALADAGLFDSVLEGDWYARFATNSLVVAYDDESIGGRRIAEASRWFDPVLAGQATLGRTDPDLDPLGYRTVLMLDLAAALYDRSSLREEVLAPDQIYPETSLLSRFETGDLDAAVVYRNMAVERDYAYVALPSAIDLSDPGRDESYADASYALSNGETVEGSHIAYGVQARTDRAATAEVFDTVVNDSILAESGFVVPDSYPRYDGDVPRGYRE